MLHRPTFSISTEATWLTNSHINMPKSCSRLSSAAAPTLSVWSAPFSPQTHTCPKSTTIYHRRRRDQMCDDAAQSKRTKPSAMGSIIKFIASHHHHRHQWIESSLVVSGSHIIPSTEKYHFVPAREKWNIHSSIFKWRSLGASFSGDFNRSDIRSIRTHGPYRLERWSRLGCLWLPPPPDIKMSGDKILA